jgi:hypothetical protein
MIFYNDFEQNPEGRYSFWTKPGLPFTSVAKKLRKTGGSEYIAVHFGESGPALMYFKDYQLEEAKAAPPNPYAPGLGGKIVGMLTGEKFVVIYNPKKRESAHQNDLDDRLKVEAVLEALRIEDKDGVKCTAIVNWVNELPDLLREVVPQTNPGNAPVTPSAPKSATPPDDVPQPKPPQNRGGRNLPRREPGDEGPRG